MFHERNKNKFLIIFFEKKGNSEYLKLLIHIFKNLILVNVFNCIIKFFKNLENGYIFIFSYHAYLYKER